MNIFEKIALALFLIGASHAKAQDAAIGDSIALGTGHALGVPTYAREDMSSCWILAHEIPDTPFDHVVISAGINDAPGACVDAIREKIRARTVVWILPAAINSARANVERVAAIHGDKTVSYLCWHGCTKWNFHPASYQQVAIDVRKIWK